MGGDGITNFGALSVFEFFFFTLVSNICKLERDSLSFPLQPATGSLQRRPAEKQDQGPGGAAATLPSGKNIFCCRWKHKKAADLSLQYLDAFTYDKHSVQIPPETLSTCKPALQLSVCRDIFGGCVRLPL